MLSTRIYLEISLSALCILWTLFCFVVLCHYRRSHFFQNRRIKLVFTELIASFITVITLACFLIGAIDTSRREIVDKVVGIMFTYSAGVTYFVVVLRMYFLYFDHHHAEAILNEQWEQNLDLNHESYSNWFLETRRWYGNTQWIVSRFSWLVLLCGMPYLATATNVIDEVRNPWIKFLAASFVASAIVLGFMVIGYAWYHLPVETDEIARRQEMKLTGIWAISLLLYSLSFGWCPATDPSETLPCYFKQITLTIPILGEAYSTTIFVIQMNLRTHTENTEFSPMKWTTFVETQAGFSLFARFLCREFSIENLLFLAEYIQFKTEFQEDIVQIQDGSVGFWIILPQTICLKPEIIRRNLITAISDTISSTVRRRGPEAECNDIVATTDFTLDSIESRGRKFYHKYIEPHKAPLEINISSSCRATMNQLFPPEKLSRMASLRRVVSPLNSTSTSSAGTENPVLFHKRILEALDDCAVQIRKLLSDSFLRFQLTDEFAKYVSRVSVQLVAERCESENTS